MLARGDLEILDLEQGTQRVSGLVLVVDDENVRHDCSRAQSV